MLPLVRLPPLDLVKGFVAVARRRSVSLAAEDLCLTQSAISKQVRALEDQLGVALFRRGFRKLELTEEGERLFALADGLVRQLQAGLADFAPRARRPVTITASTGVSGLWLGPRLAAFEAAHPDIDLRILSTNAVLDLDDEVDLAIRYCAERHAPLGATRLFGETIAPVAAPAVAAAQRVDSRAGLKGATLIDFESAGRPWLQWSHWLSARGLSTRDAAKMLRFNHYEQAIQAALGGRGVALGRLELIAHIIAAGELVVLDGVQAKVPSPSSFWLVRSERGHRQDVEQVVDWLLESAPQVAMPRADAPSP